MAIETPIAESGTITRSFARSKGKGKARELTAVAPYGAVGNGAARDDSLDALGLRLTQLLEGLLVLLLQRPQLPIECLAQGLEVVGQILACPNEASHARADALAIG
jgi:hypothetical protein